MKRTALSGPVRAGGVSGLRGPAGLEPALQQAADLYRRFNHSRPERLESVPHSRLIPRVVVELGELAGLIYRSEKGQPGQPRTYIHLMQSPPRLVSDIAGTQLYIVGGNYRVTPAGIEG